MNQSLSPASAPPPPTLVRSLDLRFFRRFRRDPIEIFTEATQKHGDVVCVLDIAGAYVVIVRHPRDIKRILQDHHKNYNKQTRGFERIRMMLGNGLLTSEGAFWLRQRRIAQPAFHRKRIEGFGERMVKATVDMLQEWEEHPPQEPLMIADEMMRLTLRIVGETMLSTDVTKDAQSVGVALEELLRQARERMFGFNPPLWMPTPANQRFRRARAVLDDIVIGMIEERRKTGEDKGDLLSMLMFAEDEETGETMNDEQLRDEVMTVFLAGHETTANALAWSLYILSKHPLVAERVCQELQETLNGRLPHIGDLPELEYLDRFLKESMRLYPPAWTIARKSVDDDVLGGFLIPKGTYVLFSPYLTHRHPDIWINPEGFDPDRFCPEREKERPRFSYFPFGGGPRICIGNHFAMMEAKLILATVLQRYQLDLVSGTRVKPQPMVTLRPNNGLPMLLRKT